LVVIAIIAVIMGNQGELDELLSFLEDPKRLDVQMVALQQVLGLTGSKDGLVFLRARLDRLVRILCQLLNGKSELLSQDAAKALVNVTSDAGLTKECLESASVADVLVTSLWSAISEENSTVADPACMSLCNLTIDSKCCDKVLKAMGKASISLERVVGILCLTEHNKKGHKLHYLAPFLSNLSQLPETRGQMLARDAVIITRLLAFTDYKGSHIRRGGIIGTLRNLCFDPAHHQWLLDESQVDILPKLLLPLAGPTPDSFDADDIDKLPMDLQYLDDDQEMEQDPDLRKMLLESIYQLCATRQSREYIRGKNAYLILRELHKTEKEEAMKDAVEDVVQLLIKKEEEIQIDSYHDVQVPPDVAQQIEEEAKQMESVDLNADDSTTTKNEESTDEKKSSSADNDDAAAKTNSADNISGKNESDKS